ncbi:hypothetical protein [Halostella sp. PRR32]|uniref:hypothetical protein n=1 Tax=Halostella sp. PRR32 TaxID=3098147 RepID=UPI00110E207C|nr:hypothetical protein [Halostella sp. PRR32]
MLSTLPLALLQVPGVLNSPLGKLFAAIVALLVIITVGRVVLSVAWKLLVVAGIGVGVLYAASLVV